MPAGWARGLMIYFLVRRLLRPPRGWAPCPAILTGCPEVLARVNCKTWYQHNFQGPLPVDAAAESDHGSTEAFDSDSVEGPRITTRNIGNAICEASDHSQGSLPTAEVVAECQGALARAAKQCEVPGQPAHRLVEGGGRTGLLATRTLSPPSSQAVPSPSPALSLPFTYENMRKLHFQDPFDTPTESVQLVCSEDSLMAVRM